MLEWNHWMPMLETTDIGFAFYGRASSAADLTLGHMTHPPRGRDSCHLVSPFQCLHGRLELTHLAFEIELRLVQPTATIMFFTAVLLVMNGMCV